MRILLSCACALVLSCLATTVAMTQQSPPPPLPSLYVQPFQPTTQTASGFGPLHAIRSGLHAHRVDENAAALSRALVTALTKLKVSAQPRAPEDPLPSSGWLVRGVFYSLDDGGHLISIPFLGSKKGPNVEVTVTLSDVAKDPNTPFAVVGSDSVLKGQGAPVGWNPYVVGARFVVHRVEGDQSLNDLANQIAQKITERAAELSNEDAARP